MVVASIHSNFGIGSGVVAEQWQMVRIGILDEGMVETKSIR